MQESSGARTLVSAALTGEDEVLVERCLECARIGDAKHRAGGLDGVSGAEARLGLRCAGEAVVDVAADAEVQVPVAGFDLVLRCRGRSL